jgi:hypothetical protein
VSTVETPSSQALARRIYYRKRKYKYVLDRSHPFKTRITGYTIITSFGELHADGTGIIYAGYGWDGCSGPTFDDKTNMRGGLIHDFFYQLMRLGLLPESCRGIVDKELQEHCREDGMGKFRAWYYLEGVDHFASFAAKYGTEPPVLTAP